MSREQHDPLVCGLFEEMDCEDCWAAREAQYEALVPPDPEPGRQLLREFLLDLLGDDIADIALAVAKEACNS
jgi:hypothetical protein